MDCASAHAAVAVSYAIRNSGQFVVPRISAPAARNRATTTASSRGSLAFMMQASDLALVSRSRNGRLHRHRQAMQSGLCGSLSIASPRLRPHALRIEVRKHIQLRIEPFNLPDVCFGQFRD